MSTIPPLAAFNIQDCLIHRDGMILIINKPSGMPVHKGPKAAGFTGKVLTEFLDDLKFGLPHTPALAHRLDRDTSGCLVLGRHRKALENLGFLFRDRHVEKHYIALVQGVVKEDSGTINAPLMKQDASKGWWMKVDEKGEEAITDWHVVERFADKTALLLKPLTGRTHQLRVHCLHLGHPMVGDTVYGYEKRGTDHRLLLHAYKIFLPKNLKKNAKEMLEVTAPVPLEMAEFFTKL